jgi:hypothetical protein
MADSLSMSRVTFRVVGLCSEIRELKTTKDHSVWAHSIRVEGVGASCEVLHKYPSPPACKVGKLHVFEGRIESSGQRTQLVLESVA